MDLIKITRIEDVYLDTELNSRQISKGTVYLTATHTIFMDDKNKKEIWIQHLLIRSIEKLPLTTRGSPVQIRCKSFMNLTLTVPKEKDCHDLLESLQNLSKVSDIENLFCFHYTGPVDVKQSDGWQFFDSQSEYLRMGVPNEYWVESKLNQNYELCQTYARSLYFPAGAATRQIIGSSKFRSRGRLPVLSYLHRNNLAAICRCSQPLAGFSARCIEDEQLLEQILKANPSTKSLYVIDTRPRVNAMVNRAQGKGYENERFYANIHFVFFSIENIHVMRSSQTKLLDACLKARKGDSVSSFLADLDSSGWLKHIKAIMDTAIFIANAIENGKSVLVHCSDGWDRTAQTCALASILLDPYYRTIQGIQGLIEKEWLSFGHKFSDRCGHLSSIDPKECSPVYAQFLESVWQLTRQFPCAFEFNERLLITLHENAYSCQYGTFIGNCEKDRLDLRLSKRTYSLWGFLNEHSREFMNPLFRKEYDITYPVLHPSTHPRNIEFWRGLFCRFEPSVHPRENLANILLTKSDYNEATGNHIRLLERRISSLCQLLGKSEETVRRKLDGIMTEASMYRLSSVLKSFDGESQVSQDEIVPNDGMVKSMESTSTLKDDKMSMSSQNESGFEDGELTSGTESCFSSLTVRNDQLSVTKLNSELNSVAVSWGPLRDPIQCQCSLQGLVATQCGTEN